MLHSTLGQCEEISDCSHTGQTFLQKRNINNVSEVEVPEQSTTRLLTEFYKLKNSPPDGVSVSLRGGDILTWDCAVWGLPEPLIKFGRFELTLTFPTDYPLQPPTVKFLSEMFHPNISADGRVPLTNWSPAHDVTKILTDIQSLLSQPHLSERCEKDPRARELTGSRDTGTGTEMTMQMTMQRINWSPAQSRILTIGEYEKERKERKLFEERYCDFDLCSSCAAKEDIENVCSSGHQLHPITGDFTEWDCDGCDYKCRPEGKVDEDVVVWRCEKDMRHQRHPRDGRLPMSSIPDLH